MGSRAIVSPVLRMLSASMIPPITMLLSNIWHFPKLCFWWHTIVSKNNHARYTKLIAKRNITFKALQEAIVLFLPNDIF
jgi:hypothetical protein